MIITRAQENYNYNLFCCIDSALLDESDTNYMYEKKERKKPCKNCSCLLIPKI